MKKKAKWFAAAAMLFGLLYMFAGFPVFPGLPGLRLLAMTGLSYRLNRSVHKIEIKLAAMRGQRPRPVSLSGKLIGSGAFVEALKGAEVVAVESTSGYAAMSDARGQFVVPHLIWFPGARYNLVITSDTHNVRCASVSAPTAYPAGGVIDAGELLLEREKEIRFAESPIRHIDHDALNGNYYKQLFERVTAASETNNGIIDAVCKYVATRHNPVENAWSFRTARQILERGAPHCSNLAFAMAAITAAGGYPTRTVHTSDNSEFVCTHVAVEVFYDDAWHLYDPTYGISFRSHSGSVASYKELRLAPELISEGAFRGIEAPVVRAAMEWMPNAYGSGLHQFYYVNEDVFFDGA